MTDATIDSTHLAGILDEAVAAARPIPQLTETVSLDVPTAYDVQSALLRRRLDRGERLTGVKLGFTSIAKMRQMGVDDLIWGRLTDAMAIENGSSVPVHRFVHPRIEPEIAFLLDAPLGEQPAGTDALRSVGAVAVAYEIIDSRYQGFRFSLPDVIADNCSAAAYGTGPWQSLRTVDLDDVEIVLEVDGRREQAGTSAAILGHPLRSVTAAARLLHAAGLVLPAGSVLLAGAATAAVPLAAGNHIRVRAETLGDVEVTIEPTEGLAS